MQLRPYLPRFFAALLLAALAGCASSSYTGAGLRAGASEADVRATMGQPYAVHKAPPGADYAQSLEYPHGPGGRQTYMARLDAGGKLIRVEQVLQERTLVKIRVGVDNMQSISDLLGRPGQYTGPNRMYGGATWDYFANEMQRHIIISVSFDRNGVVAAAGSMDDPMDFVPSGSM
ncbi:MAG TPA: outer membrane protein assembly factor BamE [Burkholderiales bacterium]|jgi:outer membrane protein assembly factor BamE (lipoprotein component of BamABCDE complex)|nr:outer membrane protein assembly factor BamE [Burkholderiales bacterium]